MAGACYYLFPPPAEASQECQHQGAEASRSRKPCYTAAKHGEDGQTQHQEGSLHYQVFLERKRPLLITYRIFSAHETYYYKMPHTQKDPGSIFDIRCQVVEG